MCVYAVADTQAKLSSVRAMLEPQHPVRADLLSTARICYDDVAAVVAVDLRVVDNISALKALSAVLSRIPKRIFLIEERTRLAMAQAYALGATHALSWPVRPAELLAKLASGAAPSIVPGAPVSSLETASTGVAGLASMFSAAASGYRIDVSDVGATGGMIADCIAENGLSDWLETVRRHHEGTYQHCLLVTGVAVDFGLSLGIAKADIKRLYSAAMFHDIGKAKIPLAILDKPDRLDDDERALVETHPAAGYEVLKTIPGISPEILDAVRHHHEFLDGSGYPDGLCAESISDIVRILTISDIFSALIEQRTYKSPMPRAAAYDVLLGMKGKLERPLVEAFRDVALNR